jgi:hypothetical protein
MALRIRGDSGVTPPPERKPASKGAPDVPQTDKADRGDRVDISEASRRLKADLTISPKSSDATRVADAPAGKRATVEERMASGFYNREEVINHIARRILDLLRRR